MFLVFLTTALPTLAYDFIVDDLCYNKNSDGKSVTVTYRIDGGDDLSLVIPRYYLKGDIKIPSAVTYDGETYSVTAIGSKSFCHCYDMTSMTIPNSVTSIGSDAFYYCEGLTSVTIGNSVASIGENAFRACSGLTSVTIPNSVTSIGNSAFYNCYGLTSVTIPNSVTSIGNSTFYNCYGLTSVTIPNSVTSIGNSAFNNCKGLTSVTIGNSVTSIGNYAFSYCSGLTSVTIPNSVSSIGNSAFYYCKGLTSVTIPNSVTSIGNSAFAYCTSLTNVVWNVKNHNDFSSEYSPFYGSNINSFEFGSEVESIPAYLCYNSGLKSVTIPNTVTSVGVWSFGKCNSLNSVVWNVNNHKDFSSSMYGPFYGSNIKSFKFGSEVERIPAYLCYGSITGSTSLIIPNSVTSIGDYAFYNCKGLTSVTIPNSVTSIGDHTFRACSGLTSVVWNVKNHEDFSSSSYGPFYESSNIKSFEFGSEVGKIPAYLCYQLTGLTSVTIPNSVTSIGYSAFYGCSSGLTSVKVEAGNSIYDSRDNSNAIIETASNTLIVGCMNTIIPNSVTSIGGGAFNGCSGLTSVTIPNSVTSIGNSAFKGCSGLTSVTIPNSVTCIGTFAFRGCSGLTSVVWNAKNCKDFVVLLNEYSPFSSCTNIKSFEFGSKVERIPSYLCCLLTGLNSIKAYPNPAKVSMGSDVFYNVPSSATLHVLPKYKSVYSSADQWYRFNIVDDLEEEIAVTGDLNGDGSVNAGDVSVLYQMITSGEAGNGDLNGDGQINAADVSALYQLMLTE